MKKVTVEEFLNFVKSDKALHDAFKTALRAAKGKTVAEAAKTVGYEIDQPAVEKLDDNALSAVSGGLWKFASTDGSGVIDIGDLFPEGLDGDFDYESLTRLLWKARTDFKK